MDNSKQITMKDTRRVLQINSGSGDFGGVSSFLYNTYLNINRDNVQFDFLSPNITTYEIHREEIENMGGRIYSLGISGNIISRKIILYFKLREFLKQHEYNIVHINSGNFFFNLVVLKALKSSKVKYRIVHSHNSGDASESHFKDLVFKILKPRLRINSTQMFACSGSAASYMFDDKAINDNLVKIIRNGIDAQRFAYRKDVRNKLRKSYGLEGKFVVGHVGRFNPQKNHEFLIDIFVEILKINPNAVLMLCGEGNLEKSIINKVDKLNIKNNVLFMGVKKDVENLYQVMDVFLLPSKYEGFGIVNIEAQASGLPVITSDTVPYDVDITDKIKHLSLNESPKKWAQEVLEYIDDVRVDSCIKVVESGYDIRHLAGKLEQYYMGLD